MRNERRISNMKMNIIIYTYSKNICEINAFKKYINTDNKNCLYPEDCFMYTYAAPDLYATDESPVAPMIA